MSKLALLVAVKMGYSLTNDREVYEGALIFDHYSRIADTMR